MKITLIQETAVHSVVLPEKMTGQYFVRHTNAMGHNENLLSVIPHDGVWTINCGMNSYIVASDNSDSIRRFSINEESGGIFICIRRTGERALLLFEDNSVPMRVFRKYTLHGGVNMGSAPGNDMCFKSKLVPEFAANIRFEGETLLYSETSPATQTFINGKRTVQKKLIPGDLIFIKGFSLIIGKNMLAINKTGLVETKNGSLMPYVYPNKDESRITRYFDERRQNNLFSVAPRFCEDIPPLDITVEQPPAHNDINRRPAILQLGPSFTMGIGSATTAAFTLINGAAAGREITEMIPTLVMSGSMMMSAMVWPIIAKMYESAHNRKVDRDTKAMYLRYLNDIRTQIAENMNRQKELLAAEYPTLSELDDFVERRTSRLWERTREHSDFLTLCLGYGNVEPQGKIIFDKPKVQVYTDVLAEEMKKLQKEPRIMTNAPVTVSLPDSRFVGITGDREKRIEIVKSLIMQITALHEYDDVKLAFICDAHEYDIWGYIRWLPHTLNKQRDTRYFAVTPEELKVISASLEHVLNGNANEENLILEHYVIVCTSSELYDKTDLFSHIGERSDKNFSVILAFEDIQDLPRECGTVITAGDEMTLRAVNSEKATRFVLSETANIDFEKCAVALANITLASARGKYNLPAMITFLDMLGIQRIEELNCAQRWRDNNPINSLAAPIGVDSRGDLFSLDLHQNVHGPHGLIAGTTGSGKSEIIMTLILSLAVNFSPREVSFLLIDYKGGGMAEAFKDLPHTAGIITNLDGASVNRSLISIESELKRRQRVFLGAGKKYGSTVNDIYTYQRLCRKDGELEPMQHLFIISDEFAELKKQQPEFMDKLISAARIGRSLGVHLILATQKPSGVVNDQIWSNSRFKICLKVQDRADSTEVIRCPDAASITQTGRFYIQVGYNEIFELGQSAWCGADYTPENTDDNSGEEIRVLDNVGRVLAQSGSKKSTQSSLGKQINFITKYIYETAENEGLRSQRLWLEPIPKTIYVEEITQKYAHDYSCSNFKAVIGEYDIPEEQRQNILCVSAEDGNIMICGSEGSGKTTFLVTYIYEHTLHLPANSAVFYILDFSSETLRAFEHYNSVGAVITVSQKEKLGNLFVYLKDELAARREKLSKYGGGYAEYKRLNSDMPAIHIIISNYGAFKESYDGYEDTIVSLSQDGQKLGIFFIITVLSPVFVKYKLAQNFRQHIAMRLNDNSYSSMFSGTNGKVPSPFKGRGLTNIMGGMVCEFQTARVYGPMKFFHPVLVKRQFKSGKIKLSNKHWSINITDSEIFKFIRSQANAVNKVFRKIAFKIKTLPAVYTPLLAEKFRKEDPLLIPIALETRFAEPVYVDFHARMIPILYSSSIEPSVVQAIIDYTAVNNRVEIIDALKTVSAPENALSAVCVRDNDACNRIYALHEEIMARHKAIKSAINANETPPKFEHIICFINGLGAFTDLIRNKAIRENSENTEEHVRAKLNDLNVILGGSRYDCHTTFVIIEKTAVMHRFTSEKWFNDHIRLNTFFWVGEKLAYEDTFIHEKISEGKTEFCEDIGYSVVKRKCQVVKYMNNSEE